MSLNWPRWEELWSIVTANAIVYLASTSQEVTADYIKLPSISLFQGAHEIWRAVKTTKGLKDKVLSGLFHNFSCFWSTEWRNVDLNTDRPHWLRLCCSDFNFLLNNYYHRTKQYSRFTTKGPGKLFTKTYCAMGMNMQH